MKERPRPMMLENANAILIVFAMAGCPACEDYTPRLIKQVEGFQALAHPFVVVGETTQIVTGQIPVVIIDAESEDPGIVAFAEKHSIEALPTTLFMTKYSGTHRVEGSINDAEIYRLLVEALRHNQ